MTKGSAIIIGGTGQIGQAVASRLMDCGWRVSLTHRGHAALPQSLAERGARAIICDRQAQGLRHAIGEGADLVIDTIAYDAADAGQLLEIQGAIGSLVVISSSSVYRDRKGRTLDEARANGFPDLPDPMTESQPTVAPGDETYSTRKVGLERRLLDAARVPVTILRPGAIHGPASVHPREWWFVKRMLDGRAVIPLAYRGESRFQTTSAVNIAVLVATVAEGPATRILNIGDSRALPVLDIGRAIGRHLGFEGRFALIDDHAYPAPVGSTPWSVPAPFTIDSSAARALGFVPLSYEETIPQSCDWLTGLAPGADWRRRFPVFGEYPQDPFDYAAEDDFLGAAAGAVPLIVCRPQG